MSQPLQFPTRCVTKGCDGFAGSSMFCPRCSEEISAIGAYRARKIKQQTAWRVRWTKARRWIARAEFVAFLAVSVAGMGLAFYAVWLLVRAWL